MTRQEVMRLKELFDSAMVVVENEWDFGEFKDQIAREKAEAEALFEKMLSEASA